LALRQNFDVRLAEQSLRQAETQVTQARAAMLPFVGGEGTYTHLDEALNFAFGPQSMTFMKQDVAKIGVVVRQPVFAGGRLTAGHEAAQYLRQSQAQQNRTVEEEIVFQITRAYRTAQVAEVFRKVAADAVGLLQAHEGNVAVLVREGSVPELDLLRTRTELANARKELNVADNALKLAHAGLKNLLAMDLDASVVLTDELGRAPRPAAELAQLTQLAMERRPELFALRCQVGAAEQGVKAAKGEFWPTVGFEARYEYMEGDVRDIEGGGHWTMGVGAAGPLWAWGKTIAGVRKAQAQLVQARLQLGKIQDLVRLEVRQAFLDLEKAEKNIAAAQAALETGREAFRQAQVRYRAGQGTNTEVLEARTALTRSEANHAQALLEYSVALAALQRAVGPGNLDAGRPETEGQSP
jgi:outer membrane protein